jgi:L,D-transpeptidase catalytic domain
MRLRRLCLPFAAVSALILVNTAAAHADILISVDKSTQRMTVTVDGVERYQWPVSTGKHGYNTPSGAYTPVSMEEHHYSRQWNWAPMPHSIFFTEQGHAIHGTYEQAELGRPVSHGCVRLSLKNATTLYALVKDEGKDHTTVVLTGKIPSENMLVAHRRLKSRHSNEYATRASEDVADAALPPPPVQRHMRYAHVAPEVAPAPPPVQRRTRYAHVAPDVAPPPPQVQRYARTAPDVAPRPYYDRAARYADVPRYYDARPRYAVAPRYSDDRPRYAGSWHDNDYAPRYAPRAYYYAPRPYPY